MKIQDRLAFNKLLNYMKNRSIIKHIKKFNIILIYLILECILKKKHKIPTIILN